MKTKIAWCLKFAFFPLSLACVPSGIKFMFLVGGFAESPMLQQAIRQNFGHLVKILIPYDVSLAILKGMVTPIRLACLKGSMHEACMFVPFL